jgi:hypothetical protein
MWHGWVALSRNNVGYSFQPIASSGNITVGMLGVDYAFRNNVVLGVALALDRSDITISGTSLTGNVGGNGASLNPYFGWAINRNWSLDGTFGVGRSKLDTNQTAAGGPSGSGSFRTDRMMGSLGLNYRNTIGNWNISGRSSLLSVQDKTSAYTLSNGNAVGGNTANISQWRFGGQLGYNAGSVSPYLGLTYTYDIRRPEQGVIAGQSAANDRDSWTPVIGLRFAASRSLYGGIQYSSEQSRSQTKNNQILLNLGLRF